MRRPQWITRRAGVLVFFNLSGGDKVEDDYWLHVRGIKRERFAWAELMARAMSRISAAIDARIGPVEVKFATAVEINSAMGRLSAMEEKLAWMAGNQPALCGKRIEQLEKDVRALRDEIRRNKRCERYIPE